MRDFLRLLRRRFANLEVLIYPVKVQGLGAAPEIVRALEDLAAYPGLEVIVLARGGGSLEDLWPFNEETVARAIHRCPVPVVSAVGHEVDFTIADFVADVRAATPSAAVELVVPDKYELQRRLDRLEASLLSTLRKRREVARRHLELMSRRLPNLGRRLVDLRLLVDDKGDILLRRTRRHLSAQRQHLRLDSSRLVLLSPRRALLPWRQRLEQAGQRLGQSFRRGREDSRRHLEYCQSHLEQLNPLAILQRGYAVATLLPQETVIRDAAQVPVGAGVRVRVARGRLDCEVEKVSSEQ